MSQGKGVFFFLTFTLIHCALPFDRQKIYPSFANATSTDIFLRVAFENDSVLEIGKIVPRNIVSLDYHHSPIVRIEVMDSLSKVLKTINSQEYDLTYQRVQNKKEVWVFDTSGFHVIPMTNQWWYDTYLETMDKKKRD